MIDFGSIISKINYSLSKPTIEAAVMDRGNPLGKWTGSAYEFDMLNRRLIGTGIQLVVTKKE